MEELMMRILNTSGQAAIIFVVLLAVRGLFALGRVPRKYAYGLWAILFVRLLLPIQMETDWGLMPRDNSLARAVENAAGAAGWGKTAEDLELVGELYPPDSQPVVQGTHSGSPAGLPEVTAMDAQSAQVGLSPGPKKRRGLTGWGLCAGVWAAVCTVLWGYGVFSYLRLKRRLRCRIPLEGWGESVYLVDGIGTPFVLGLAAPGIYLPSDMAQDSLPYVIAHERVHIRRRDYLVKTAAYLAACLYWFHPLVWAGFVLMSKDMEMSCDEAVLRQMGRDCRGEYADSLVRLTCGERSLAGVPLAFGEGSTRGRVRHIMKYKKSTAAVALAAAALTVALAAALLTSPREPGGGESRSGKPLSGPGESGEIPGAGGSTAQFQVEYEVIPCPAAVRTGYTSLGADGAILDYADGESIIFHGYFGLYVYSVSAGQITGAVDLQALGCDKTQGEDACQVLVTEDGARVYFYPLSAEREGGPLYRYEVSGGELRRLSYGLGDGGGSEEKLELHRLLGEELADGGQSPGYLKSASWILEDLVYVRESGHDEGQEGRRVEYTWLLGADGQGSSTVSYEPADPGRIRIDGTTYDLSQAMTECRFGDEAIDVIDVNAVTDVQCVDGRWLVEGHISPLLGTYSIYDPGEKKWEDHIVGSCLAWDSGDESAALRTGSRLDTAIYARYNEIYSRRDGKLAVLVDPRQAQSQMQFWTEGQQTGDGLPLEEIAGLSRQGDQISVVVRSTQTEEERTVEFSYEDALRRVIIFQ